MNRLELLAAAALLIMVTRADAAGPGYIFDDPEVERPQCYTLFGLPCHVRQGGNDPLKDGDTKKPPKPTPPSVCSSLRVGEMYANRKPEKECA